MDGNREDEHQVMNKAHMQVSLQDQPQQTRVNRRISYF